MPAIFTLTEDIESLAELAGVEREDHPRDFVTKTFVETRKLIRTLKSDRADARRRVAELEAALREFGADE